jgi:hypothetical protein
MRAPTSTSSLDWALYYAGLGYEIISVWPVLDDGTCSCGSRQAPCRMPGKHPASRWRLGDATERPTKAPALIREIFNPKRTRNGISRGNFGVGLVTGGGFSGIDCDNKPAQGKDGVAAFAELERLHGPVGPGPRQRTGSGGLHILVRTEPGQDLGLTVDRIAPGVDTRGNGGFIVVAPTRSKHLNRYEWLRELTPVDQLPACPSWVFDRVRPRTANGLVRAPQGHRARPQRSRAEALQTLLNQLDHPLLHWCRENPDNVSREVWRGIATNLVAAADGHPDVLDLAEDAFHEVSEPASCYRHSECSREFRHALDSVRTHGPMRFDRMVEFGAPEDLCTGGSALIAAATSLKRSASR